MKAGRELDALVAEKVMGWKARHREDKCDGIHIIKCGACGRFGHANCYGQFGGGEIQLLCVEASCCQTAQPPEYSTSIADAWQVVEKLANDGWDLDLVYLDLEYKGRGRSHAFTAEGSFSRWEDGMLRTGHQVADTVPLFICLAALQVLGVEVGP
jgi:hypothetical protein